MLKRLSLSLIAIAAITVTVSAATFALFTAGAKNEGNTFSAGTVSLNETSSQSFAITNAMPGDSGTGSYTVEYDGTLNAWLGLSVGAQGDLFTCDVAYAPAVTVSDGTNTYPLPAVDPANPTALATGPMTLVGAVAAPTPTVTESRTITVNWNLPLDMGNSCQDKSGSVVLTLKAVQQDSNPNDAGGPDWN
jgi:spore coat-associated protein N